MHKLWVLDWTVAELVASKRLFPPLVLPTWSATVLVLGGIFLVLNIFFMTRLCQENAALSHTRTPLLNQLKIKQQVSLTQSPFQSSTRHGSRFRKWTFGSQRF